MDLGLAGRKAIVCASSHGLGKACALALAREGVEVVINGGPSPARFEDYDHAAWLVGDGEVAASPHGPIDGGSYAGLI